MHKFLFFLFGLMLLTFAAEAQTPTNTNDSLALVAIYNSTTGTNWTHNDNWLTGNVPTWYGITVDTTGRVTAIDLSNNGLSGTIPGDIGNLDALQSLSLYYNQLTGTIPNYIGNLVNLKYLGLYNNQLSGSIPKEIGYLTSLETLDLSHNQLSDTIPPTLGDLGNLKYLKLTANNLSGSLPPQLGNLGNLISLEINYNQLSGNIPPELGNLHNLTKLELYHNYLSGSIPPELANLSNLQVLDLNNNHLSDTIPPDLGSMSNLEYLVLNTNLFSGSLPEELGNLQNLVKLDISVNHLTGAIPHELGNLSKLQYLILNDNMLTDTIPEEIGNLSALTNLSLHKNQLSGPIPPELGSLSNLNYLNLGNNKLTGEIPPELGSLSNLMTLDLRGNNLTGKIPPEIGGMTTLMWMYLNSNQLGDTLPSELGDLSNLRSLDLSYNQFTGKIPQELENLSNLTELVINDNLLTELIDFSGFSNMQTLYLSNNKLTFEDLEPLVSLSIPHIYYSPQLKVGQEEFHGLNAGESLTIAVSVGGSHNTYQWYKNGVAISGATDSSYTIASYDNVVDSGDYVCHIQNTVVTGVTLESYSIHVRKKYSLSVNATVNPTDAGTITGDGTYSYGDTAILVATPNTGYKFLQWTADSTVISHNDTLILVVSQDTNLTAFFTDTFDIVATVNPSDAGQVTGQGSYKYGEEVTLIAKPNSGYKFDNWTENGSIVSQDTAYTFTVEGDRQLVANFSTISSIVHGGKDVNIMLYPNPCRDVLNIRSQATISHYKIFNLQGRIMTQDKISTQISVSGLDNGIYILRLYDRNGQLLQQAKIIIVK